MANSEGGTSGTSRNWRQILLVGLAFVAGFGVLSIVGIQLWDYSNSVAFCSNACHDVHPEEPEAFTDSYHARVKCTECHMGRLGMLRSIALKATHAKHLPAVLFNTYERPLESETMRPANESCEECHWPPAFHGDTVREIVTFQPGEDNSRERIYLIMKTGGGERSKGLGVGIHWHIANQVEYIATDQEEQTIPWVRSMLPDGRVVEYNDVLNPLSPQEIASAEKHVMDCVDCHNRVGHPFPPPDRAIDQAMAEGAISSDLPHIKAVMSELLNASYADREAAREAVGQLGAIYAERYPDVAEAHGEAIEQAAEVAEGLLARVVFEEPGVSWESFPDNGRHTEFPGCFRCHDGKHLSGEGESIRLHCNICHSIPEVVSGNARPPQMPVATLQEPSTHLETNFIADHRFQADESCATCHAASPATFGTDNSGFCANSACHGRQWPEVKLDAAFPHPIPLEGKHASVWCNDCHQGVQRPEYVCANCHEPPMQPHFGGECEECHTTEGFALAQLDEFTHPVALEGAHAELRCSDCHVAGKDLSYDCATCHEPPSANHFGPNCADCHDPYGFRGATLPPELHPVPLEGAHLRATCDVCHAEGKRVPEYVCSNCHRPPENHFDDTCDTCHSPTDWIQSAAPLVMESPGVPHDLEGREDCLMCHDPTGKIKPAPADHDGRPNEQCTLCHKAAEQ